MFISLCIIVVFLLLLLLIVLYHLPTWNVWCGLSDTSRVWASPFECGFLGESVSENVFSYTYFILLVFFVIFDLEVSLLLNLPYQGVLYKNFFFYFFFLVLLVVGYFVEISKGYVGWNIWGLFVLSLLTMMGIRESFRFSSVEWFSLFWLFVFNTSGVFCVGSITV